MPDQIIDMAGVTDVTLDGSTVSAIILDGVEIFTYAAPSMDYLVIGGGGQGGGRMGGGGGAGGLRTSWGTDSGGGANPEPSIPIGTHYLISVGVGGSGGNNRAHGVQGGPSRLYTSQNDIATSNGGGGGGCYRNVMAPDNGNYGSGGGRGGGNSGVHVGNIGRVNEGFRGGSSSSSNYVSGGGGGSNQLGGNGIGTQSGSGGNGILSDILGYDLYWAGGGGGGTYSNHGAGNGGEGGGGGGRSGTGAATSGGTGYNNGFDALPASAGRYTGAYAGDYTGGGGGGGAFNPGRGGKGGKGTVILRVKTTNYTGTHTGNPIVTVVGDDTVMMFLNDGSYTS